MDIKDISPDLLYELSKEVLSGLNIDLTNINVDEKEYMKLACLYLLEQQQNLSEDERLITALTTNVVLMLQNFLLELKLLHIIKDHG